MGFFNRATRAVANPKATTPVAAPAKIAGGLASQRQAGASPKAAGFAGMLKRVGGVFGRR